MAGQFSSLRIEHRPVGIRTAIELMDRKWMKMNVYSPALRSIHETWA